MLALPHIVRCAQLRRTITYSELGKRIAVHHRGFYHSLGYIRDEICGTRDIPRLNVLVVNKGTDLPGEGFLPEGDRPRSKRELKQKFEELRDEVFAFEGWDDLLVRLGLQPVPGLEAEFDEEAREYDRYVKKTRSTGEGDRHRLLKEYVASHPESIGLLGRPSGTTEYAFPSGDECDVVFSLGDSSGHAVVEIKNGHRGELVRGIYQAIKYRALMVAEKGHGREYPVSAYLVAYSIPSDIRSFADKFDVACWTVNEELLDTRSGTQARQS